MKKLTAGIFATLLAVVSADGAYAAIASKGYVDDKVGTVEATVATKADKSALDTLSGTVTGHTTQIGTINTTLSKKLDSDTAASTYQTLANKTTSVSGDSTDTQYPSAKAVWTAVQSVDANASVEALEGRVDSLETNSATKTELATKQDKNMGTGAANRIVTTDASGNITSSATIDADKVSGLADVATTGAYGDLSGTPSLGTLASKSTITSAEITDGTIAEADLNTTINASLDKADSALQKTTADAAYAGKTLETQVGTVSKENMGTTTATTVVAGVKEAIDAAKAADTKAGSAASAASAAQSAAGTAQAAAEAAQGDVDALEKTVSAQGTRLTTAEGDIDTIQGQISNMATNATVTSLTERVTTAEGDITALETAVNDAESGLVATNAIADEALANAATAQRAAEAAQTAADSKQDKLTQTGSASQPVYVDATGKVTAGNTIPTVTTNIAAGQTGAAQAGAVATALAAKANSADVYTKTTANSTFIPRPGTNCTATGAKCVLVTNGTGFEWEVIARDGEGA